MSAVERLAPKTLLLCRSKCV